MTIAAHTTAVPTWFDPGQSLGQYSAFMTLYALHDALVKPLPGDEQTPSLAKDWNRSDDGKTYEFTLRENIFFHNDEPVTAEDVKFSFERYQPATAPIKQRVESIEVVSPTVVRFHLKDPWPDFMTHYGTLVSGAGWIVPKKYVEEVGDDGFLKQPIGAGPYKFVSYTPGVDLVLEAFDKYWRKAPTVKRVVMKFIPDEVTRLAMLQSGEVDVSYVLTGSAGENVKADPSLSLKIGYLPSTLWLILPGQWKEGNPWSDVMVRQAANLAINREAMNEAFYMGYATPASSTVSAKQALAWDPPAYKHDVEEAKRLLAVAGYPSGFDAGPLYVLQNYQGQAEAAANDLLSIGIKVSIRPLERASYYARWAEKSLDDGVVFAAIGSPGNAATRLEETATETGRWSFGTYPEITDLFNQQANELDEGKRKQLLEDLQKAVHERAMFIPLLINPGLSASGPRVKEPALDLVPNYSYTAPFEDLALNP